LEAADASIEDRASQREVNKKRVASRAQARSFFIAQRVRDMRARKKNRPRGPDLVEIMLHNLVEFVQILIKLFPELVCGRSSRRNGDDAYAQEAFSFFVQGGTRSEQFCD